MVKHVTSQQAAMYANIHYSADKLSIVGFVGAIGFPLYYFIWHDLFPQPYENLYLRLLGSAICFPFIVHKYWPKVLVKYLPIYWNLAILYSLPFFFTYMLLKNDFNQAWSMSALVAIFIVMMVANSWKNLVFQFVTGTLLGWAAFTLQQGEIVFSGMLFEYLSVALFAVIVGGLFNYRSYMARLRLEKLKTLVDANSNVAHELRTPLLSIKSNSTGLEAYLPLLLNTYHEAKKHGLNVPFIRKEHERKLMDIPKCIGKETDYANTVIDMLLVSSDTEVIQKSDFTEQSIRSCIQTTLQRYPFNSEEDRQRVICKGDEDFTFIGSDILTVHILFNLLKNALYAIAKAGKGEVIISLSSSGSFNHLSFRDTGAGINKEDLSHIFERFYSTSKYGHGVGLSYCAMVMQSFQGNIECFSVEHEYTEFRLNFPRELS